MYMYICMSVCTALRKTRLRLRQPPKMGPWRAHGPAKRRAGPQRTYGLAMLQSEISRWIQKVEPPIRDSNTPIAHHGVGFLFLACTRPPAPSPARARPPAGSPRPRPHKQCTPTNSPTNVRQPARTNQRAPSNAHQRIRTNQRAPSNADQRTHAKQRTSNAHQRTPRNAHQPRHSRRETVARAYSRGPWRWRRKLLDRRLTVAARAFGPPRFGVETAYFRRLLRAWKGRHFWSRGPRNRGRGVL